MEKSYHNGLSFKTAKVFEDVSRLKCIEGMYLCGGTAEALILGHRQSEDLDFELIATKRIQHSLPMGEILQELKETFPLGRREILSDNHCEYYVPSEGELVKLSFFKPANPVPSLGKGFEHNNVKTPTLQELLGMKMFNLTVRTEFKDYYDIFSAVIKGGKILDAIDYACRFSRHTVHSKDIMSTLMTPALFPVPKDFKQFAPLYSGMDAALMKEHLMDHLNKEVDEKERKASKMKELPEPMIRKGFHK